MWLILLLLTAPPESKAFTSPATESAEYGHGLTKEQALEGWIALFDGATTFGWQGAEVQGGAVAGGTTTNSFGACRLQGEATSAGEIHLGDQILKVAAGKFQLQLMLKTPAPIVLPSGLKLKTLLLKPTGMQTLFDGKNLEGWKKLTHPKLPAERQATWTLEKDALHARGGPGAMESEGRYGDMILQVEVKTRAPLVNGGVFFRSIPGDFMNGYEAQLFNACYERDPAKPARYSTGAIDDRQMARRLVSRDRQPLLLTILAVGPHLATWVNGYQTTDWTDDRPAHDNPRLGLRLEPGTIQLQAHDPETDIEFRRVMIGTSIGCRFGRTG
jgi:hypothetical protein